MFAPEPLATLTPTLPSWIVTATVRAFLGLLPFAVSPDTRMYEPSKRGIPHSMLTLVSGWARAGSPARMRSAVAGPLGVGLAPGSRCPGVPLPVSPPHAVKAAAVSSAVARRALLSGDTGEKAGARVTRSQGFPCRRQSTYGPLYMGLLAIRPAGHEHEPGSRCAPVDGQRATRPTARNLNGSPALG